MKKSAKSYPWPIAELLASVDATPSGHDVKEVRTFLFESGLPESLIDFLAPLYAALDGATFLQGRLRLLPLEGDPENGLPDLISWNHPAGWQQFVESGRPAVYFMTNTFGDQFGVPVDEDYELGEDRVAMLWINKSEFQEGGYRWSDLAKGIGSDPRAAAYFGRKDEADWAKQHLGEIETWQVYGMKAPAALDGPSTPENFVVRTMVEHVMLTPQLIHLIRDHGEEDVDLEEDLVSVYDTDGCLLLDDDESEDEDGERED